MQRLIVLTQEGEVIIENQKRENQRMEEALEDIEKRIAKYSDRFEKLEKGVCNEQVEKLEQELGEYVIGGEEMEEQITQAINELKESLKRHVDERMEGMEKTLIDTQETMKTHCVAIQSENDSLKQMLKQIQESLCEEEEAKRKSIDPTEPTPLPPRPSEFTKPPGLTGFFGEEIRPNRQEKMKKDPFSLLSILVRRQTAYASSES